MSPRIFVTKPIPDTGIDMLKRCGQVEVGPGSDTLTVAELRQKVTGVSAILCFVADPIDASVLEAAAPTCKVVASYGVGVDNIDIDSATRLGIRVTNTPDVLTDATADLAFALILAVARRLNDAQHVAHSGQWRGIEPMQIFGCDVSGKTLGIIGAGRIGRAVARRAAGFDMQVVHTSRSDQPDLTEQGARRLELKELLATADFVSLHVPLSDQTHHLIGDEEFALMKPSAHLINTSRGAVVDQGALIAALRSGVIAGAGLDVFEHEPAIPAELLAMSNVVCLPHIGSATRETRERMAVVAATNLIACLKGETPPNPAN